MGKSIAPSLFRLLFSLFLALSVSTACVRWSPPAVSPVATGSCRSAGTEWLAPDDARERTRLDSWCAGVGEPIIRALASPDASVDMASVTFVSWNVHVGLADMRAFVDDLRAGQLTGGRPVHHYVLMLQEVVRTGGVPPLAATASGASRIAPRPPMQATDVVDFAQERGLSLVYVPSMRNGTSANEPAEDRGSAILSTLSLANPRAIELPGERQRRVVILADAGSFAVGSVHLDAFGGPRRLRVFWTTWMRDVQVRTLRQALPDGPLVLGADLNTWHGPNEFAVRSLRVAFPGARVSDDRDGPGWRRLDYVFMRPPPGLTARYGEVEDKYGSDHRPLVGWIE